ncbi:MBL fold metallo-hydrolase [Vulcanococcus sp.]|jgi:L-ascorbate metabolism protein UlaG (beta-lactamase superfamily)|uniref:MBL fold metallo-hydrolase n=1 Tax=Vulcanococcus sp. TaxID=2856995 RepID=UPI003238C471
MALPIRTLAAMAAPLTALALPLAASANTGVTITSYGHSALLIQGGGASVLLNPFKAVGCAAGLAEPRVSANVILASSLLLDEGAPVASGRLLSKPGSYRLAGLSIEGISAPHDRFGGRRFGQATLWRWKQGGLVFAHLGGTAAKLTPEDRVLLGKPDVLILGVGGGAKVYDGAEAAAVVRELSPKRVIPVQYVSGTSPKSCDQSSVEPFLEAMKGTSVKRVGRVLSLPSKLNDSTQIDVMR